MPFVDHFVNRFSSKGAGPHGPDQLILPVPSNRRCQGPACEAGGYPCERTSCLVMKKLPNVCKNFPCHFFTMLTITFGFSDLDIHQSHCWIGNPIASLMLGKRQKNRTFNLSPGVT